MTNELFYRLLDKGEGELIDFKRNHYFTTDLLKPELRKKTFDFVKDIISFANTPRNESAYILIGVEERNDKKGVPVGIPDTQLIDDATLQEKVKDKAYPIPKFSSRVFLTKDGKKIAVIEIPVVKYIRPVEFKKGYKERLKKGMVYFRRGSSNTEASVDDIITINNWLNTIEEFAHVKQENDNFVKDKTKDISIVKSVFVIGGITGETEKTKYEKSSLHTFCLILGEELAKAGIKLILCSPFPDSADYYTAQGFSLGDSNNPIDFHIPGGDEILKELEELEEKLFPNGPSFRTYLHPEPERVIGDDFKAENLEAIKQAYLISQIQALRNAEAIIALGGKRWASANTLLHIAEWEGKPIIPFNFLGGAAGKLFKRINWQKLHPKIDTKLLNDVKGAREIVKTLNQLKIDYLINSQKSANFPEKIFISRSTKDRDIADELGFFLESKKFEVFFGDDMFRTDQELIVSIKDTIIKSDIIIILWSQNYALSKWCYDELMIAIDRQKTGHSGLWIFNLDKSDIVPREARDKNVFDGQSITQITNTIENILLELSSKN